MIIRRLTSADVELAVPLMGELGYATTSEAFAERIAAVDASPDDVVLVAEDQGSLLGLVSAHSCEMLHRTGRLGRITALVVAATAQGRGIGTQLLCAAESHLRAHGCIQLEVTSGEHRESAHAFYTARGYREKRVRFVKSPGT